MNTDSILKQFGLVDSSIYRAKLIVETGFTDKSNKEVVLYELIKAYKQIENMVREIEPNRFGVKTIAATQTPSLDEARLFLCPYCGNPDCQSDHK